MNCPACQTPIVAGQTFCPTCRARGAQPSTDRNERLFLVIACLFSVGAFAIPRLVRSKAFGPVGKLVLGTIAALQTLGAVALVVFVAWEGPRLFMRYMHWIQGLQH